MQKSLCFILYAFCFLRRSQPTAPAAPAPIRMMAPGPVSPTGACTGCAGIIAAMGRKEGMYAGADDDADCVAIDEDEEACVPLSMFTWVHHGFFTVEPTGCSLRMACASGTFFTMGIFCFAAAARIAAASTSSPLAVTVAQGSGSERNLRATAISVGFTMMMSASRTRFNA